MIRYMVGKLAPNSSQLTKGLVKYVPGRGCFRAVFSQNGDKFVTSPPHQSLNYSNLGGTYIYCVSPNVTLLIQYALYFIFLKTLHLCIITLVSLTSRLP